MHARQASVFISYSRLDQTFVRELMNALSASGREVWVDWESIEKGTFWRERIQAGIDNQDAFVFVVSPSSLTSEICNRELAYAIAQNKRILPVVRHELVEPWLLEQWQGKAWEATAQANWTKLKEINWLFCRVSDDFGQAVESLEHDLNRDIDYLTSHTALGARALLWDRREHENGYLARGAELREMEKWLKKADSDLKDPPPSDLHRDYIAASRQYDNRNRRGNLFIFGAAILFLIAIILLLAFSYYAASLVPGSGSGS